MHQVMAYLWNVLREDFGVSTACTADRMFDTCCEEISGTIDDFREKGAWGAFKDATLDAVDLVQDAGEFLF